MIWALVNLVQKVCMIKYLLIVRNNEARTKIICLVNEEWRKNNIVEWGMNNKE